MTEEEQAKELLRRYIALEASPQEIKKVTQWYESLELKDQQLAATAKAAIGEEILSELRLAMNKSAADLQPAAAEINAGIPVTTATPLIRKIYTSYWSAITKVAAVLLVGSAVGLGIWSYTGHHAIADQDILVSTGAAQRKRVTLADGSEIMMEPLAKLTYPSKFKAGSRNVVLSQGQAFFNIAHDTKRPFTVRTASGVCVKVLGTSFSVRSDLKTQDIKVTVATGKVEVRNQKGALGTLTRDQQLSFKKKSGKAAISHYKNPVAVKLNFESATLQQIVERLEYSYNVQIRIDDAELRKLKSTAIFSTKQEPAVILDILCNLHHLQFSQSRDHQTFKIYR